MATVIFRIRGIGETAGIKIRFKDGNFDYEFSIGIKVNRSHWSNKQQRVKNMIEAPYREKLNKKLNELRTYIMNSYYDASATKTKITKLWLKEKVSVFLNEPLNKGDESKFFFLPYIEKFIKEAKSPYNKNSRTRISEGTINNYRTTVLKLKDFEVRYSLKLKISDINLAFHTKFHQYLSEVLLLNPNTIGGYFSRIKLFCNSAEIQGLEVSKELKSKNFYTPQNTTNDIYLNKEEIDLIFNHQFDSERLDNARDWLIIAVSTGLRVSDLLNLSMDNIEEDYIHVNTFKTKTNVVIPIHSKVQAIIKKHNNNFPKKLSSQRLNDYLKEVCKIVGLIEIVSGSKMVPVNLNGKNIYRKKIDDYPKHELISSHIGRRSFATNAMGTVPIHTIMKVTGHKDLQTFLSYIKKTPMDYAEEMKKSWEN